MGVRSMSQIPVELNLIVAAILLELPSGCIKIQPIPSTDQSFFRMISLLLSNRFKTEEFVSFYLKLAKR